MKRLILTVAILGASLTANAFSENISPVEKVVNITVDGEFVEVATDKLPQAITDAVAKDYEGATISKAYINISQQYKLELTVDEAVNTVYISKDGYWLKEEDIADSEK